MVITYDMLHNFTFQLHIYNIPRIENKNVEHLWKTDSNRSSFIQNVLLNIELNSALFLILKNKCLLLFLFFFCKTNF